MLEHLDTILSFAVVMLLLSLLVTTIVQMFVAALSLRSTILKMGIERLLKQVAPNDLKEHAARIAAAVVCHPAVVTERSWPAAALRKLWASIKGQPTAPRPCATDIKKEELVRLLGDLAKNPPDGLPSDAANALKNLMTTDTRKEELIRLLGDLAKNPPNGFPADVAKTLKDLLDVATLPQTKVLADTIQTELEKVFPIPSEVARIKRIVDEARERTSKFAGDVTAWFDTVIDRTTDEFLQRTRWITVGCALVLPLVLHVDSLQIFRQLASNPEMRAKLVQMTDATLDKAAQAFVLAEGSTSLASKAIHQACKDCNEIAVAYELKNVPSGLATRAQGVAWLTVKFGEPPKDPNHPKKFLPAYHKRFDEHAATQLQGLAQCAREIKTTLDNSTLTIFEIPVTWKGAWKNYWGWWSDGMHFWGTLVTAVFLSLGAPFWYNALKQLSNLRPAIAQKVDQAAQPKE